ncbi:MAG: hypothetical protein KatS3mg077_1157 [Candidatus Binatia bacterium]|nr:MAG: hypothetical protein KatS3mg077_1157 [Candidatus Binatia bacterium]
MPDHLDPLCEQLLAAYRAHPALIREHYGIEQTVLAGGYGYRQVFELVQNGADAEWETWDAGRPTPEGGRIAVVLAAPYLYVANTGAPLSQEGIEALLSSHSSPKRGNQIGRFGLGFKSLLRLGGKVDLFSRGRGVLRFDPSRCRRFVQEEFGVRDAPALRLAWWLDAAEWDSDPILSEFDWAETIVRAEIGDPTATAHLEKEITNFPGEFLLFFPFPLRLRLDSGRGQRVVSVEVQGKERILYDGNEQSRWLLVQNEIMLTDPEAVQDATHVHARDRVPLSWAVPLQGRREESGRFWAFFPTRTATFLPGILNAPWKLNSDRNALVPGPWNAALMREGARMILDTLPELSSPTDPGRPLDFFPRQTERKDEDASPLLETLWNELTQRPLVADGSGRLQHPRELQRHPLDSPELARSWTELAEEHRRAEFVHPSCLIGQRPARLNALAERLRAATASVGRTNPGMLQRCDPRSWFSAVASTDSATARRVLQLAEQYSKECTSSVWASIRAELRIIVNAKGGLVDARTAVLVPAEVPSPGESSAVADFLMADSHSKRILMEVLKVPSLSDEWWLEVLREVRRGRLGGQELDRNTRCHVLWRLLRSAPKVAVQTFLREQENAIPIMRGDGEWAPPSEVLLPGTFIRPDDEQNTRALVDLKYHAEDKELLSVAGVRDHPELRNGRAPSAYCTNVLAEPWLSHWRWEYYCNVDRRPRSAHLGPWNTKFPGGTTLLELLGGLPNAQLTEAILGLFEDGHLPTTVHFFHETQERYRPLDVPHPLLWILRKHGRLRVGDTTVSLRAVLARWNCSVVREATNPLRWQRTFPVLSTTEPAVDPTSTDVSELWHAVFHQYDLTASGNSASLGELFAAASVDDFVPSVVHIDGRRCAIQEIYVADSEALAVRARGLGVPAIAIPTEDKPRWVQKGAKALDQLFEARWDDAHLPPGLITEIVPELAEVLPAADFRNVLGQPVSNLRLAFDGREIPQPSLFWHGLLYLDLAHLAALPRQSRLRAVLNDLIAAGCMSDCSLDTVLAQLADAELERLREKLARATSLAERVLLLVGGQTEALFQALGHAGRLEMIRHCSDMQLAELLLARLGPATLAALAPALEAQGLRPPQRWGTAKARSFVTSMGFPEEFAVAAESPLDAEEVVSGPLLLPPLHDFQTELLRDLQGLLETPAERRRAVISLPTGAGKTRVAVEAAVRFVLAPPRPPRSVLWVAQTEELCEQAVAAFRQAWMNFGAEGTNLRIVRLWGGNPNPAPESPNSPVVVVSSIQTLNFRVGSSDLEWLYPPGLVVIDECHHAIAPSYSKVLRWIEGRHLSDATPKVEPPILGLSATPFRADDEESRRLARRFDNRWFPANQAELHQRLVTEKILTRVRYQALDSNVSAPPAIIERLLDLMDKGEGVKFDRAVDDLNLFFAESEERNEWLVSIVTGAPERSILFFANSVRHAEEMAVRLHLAGVPAAAVTGSTPSAARRCFLRAFQDGSVRVLCNHSVLSTGFDAPKTDMILIARHVFSPVRYMQMVGRGLRGPKNGGTESCRIVTVLDNLGRFADRHPYHYCARYFSDTASDDSTRRIAL